MQSGPEQLCFLNVFRAPKSAYLQREVLWKALPERPSSAARCLAVGLSQSPAEQLLPFMFMAGSTRDILGRLPLLWLVAGSRRWSCKQKTERQRPIEALVYMVSTRWNNLMSRRVGTSRYVEVVQHLDDNIIVLWSIQKGHSLKGSFT